MKLVIFDCDGTLVDSERLGNLALQQQLAQFDIHYGVDELLEKFRGGKLASIIASLEQECRVVFPITFEAEYRAKMNALFDEHLKPNDGVKEMLESLSIPCCIASSAPKAKIDRALEITGLTDYFGDNIFSSYDVGSWKPDPQLFLHAAQQMKSDPKDCCVVEDSVIGLQAAKSAQMKSIYYAPNLSVQHELASVQIRHMSELSNHIATTL